MLTHLRTSLNAMAAEFAASIIEAIRASSLADILDVPLPAEPRRDRGRPKGSRCLSASPLAIVGRWAARVSPRSAWTSGPCSTLDRRGGRGRSLIAP